VSWKPGQISLDDSCSNGLKFVGTLFVRLAANGNKVNNVGRHFMYASRRQEI
jgi:hypothetical protein